MIDALAGIITFTHTDDRDHKTRAVSIVTASVDRIHFKKTLDPHQNMRLIGLKLNLINLSNYANWYGVLLQGVPTWVGKSSMEIRIDIDAEKGV